MSDEELAKVIDELSEKSPEERDEYMGSNGISGEDVEIILEAIEALKDLVEDKADVQAEDTLESEESGADETMTEDLSEGAETVDVDGDGDDDAVVIEEEEKHGDEDEPHAKGVIRPVNILKALSAFKY